MTGRRDQPPFLARALLAGLLPARLREQVVDDLDEEFRARVAEPDGVARGRRWYRSQVLRSIAPAIALRFRTKSHNPRVTTGPPNRQRTMSALHRDISFAIRTLIKAPVFSVTALITIALGIGATTAIFSVVNTVLLQPLPYDHRDRLAFITSDMTTRGVRDFPLAPADFADLRNNVNSFDEIAGLVTAPQPMFDDRGESRMVRTAFVTGNIFRTLGARVAIGRDFADEDDTPVGPPPGQNAVQVQPQGIQPPQVAILGYDFWQQQFGGDSGIIGRTFPMGNEGNTARVVGVLEPGLQLLWFEGSNIERRPEVFVTMRQDFAAGSRINHFMRVVGRLRSDASLASAQEELNAAGSDLRERFPIKETAGAVWRVEPMHEYLVANTTQSLWTLLGAVVFVLLIACANVANLLLVRTSQRERELAVRSALGGNRGALLRQMLVESFVLAGVGAASGVALAWGGIRLLVAIGPANLPRLDQVSLDPVVLGFTAAVAIASALTFGVVPALRASRVDVADLLRSSGRSPSLSGRGRWLRAGVVTAEVALAFVLLVGSGLMIRSFVALQQAHPGFDPAGVVMFGLANAQAQTPEGRAAISRTVHERLNNMPGVAGVTASSLIPLEGFGSNARWGPEGALTNPALFKQADLRAILPNYFDVMRTALVDGRVFEDADNVPGLNRTVIDDVLAAKAFPGERAVGKRFVARIGGPEPEWFEVIGVVRHQRNYSLAADGRETMYVTDGQFEFGAANQWILRTSGNPSGLMPSIRAAIRDINPRYVVNNPRTMDLLVGRAQAPTRFALACLGVFAIVAAFLAGIGLYGVVSTLVRQRTAEIGVRMAFGASSANILNLVARHGLKLSALGIGLGLLTAFAVTRMMSTMLVGVSPTDPLTFAAIAAFFLSITALACWIPARRASRLDPVVALRDE
jgi:predicted permease